MNDELIVINGFPNNIKREKILKNCINQFRKCNREILLVTHYPTKSEIQNIVDYYIYDSRNIILKDSMIYWYRGGNLYFQSTAFSFGVISYAVLLSIQNAICFAKNLGKKFFYYFEYDSFISDDDLTTLNKIRNTINNESKKGYILTNEASKEIYAIFLMMDVDFYLDNVPIIHSEEEYNKSNADIALELFLYKNIFKNFSNLHIEYRDHLHTLFPTSSFNLSCSSVTHFIDILPEKQTKKPIFVISNPDGYLKECKTIEYFIVFEKNNETTTEIVSVVSNGYYYNIISNKVENIKVYYEHELIFNKNPWIEVKNKNQNDYAIIK